MSTGKTMEQQPGEGIEKTITGSAEDFKEKIS